MHAGWVRGGQDDQRQHQRWPKTFNDSFHAQSIWGWAYQINHTC
jgi:hypothetical protein